MAFSALGALEKYDIQDIGTLQTVSSMAIDLNDNGQILGWYNIDGSNEGKRFFVTDKDGSFYEIERYNGWTIEWKYLTNSGKAYGTYSGQGSFGALLSWTPQTGVSNLGNLPGKEISAINDAGQVLIKSVDGNDSQGKSIKYPIIWCNGKVTKLNGLDGDLGTASGESYGFAMNSNGEVVGQSLVDLVYKNKVYKKVHATKWVNGQAIDIHNTIPKTSQSCAIAINDMGDFFIHDVDENNKFLVRNDGLTIQHSYDLNMLSNSGHVYNYNYDYGLPVPPKNIGFIVKDRDGKEACVDSFIQNQIKKDLDSIWTKVIKIIRVNSSGKILAQGETIYGEQHAMILNPIIKSDELTNKNTV